MKPVKIQKLFKPYIVRRKNGQCQVLIPLIELDDLCGKIEQTISNNISITSEAPTQNDKSQKSQGKRDAEGGT